MKTKIANIIKESHKIVVLTGAGISTNAGVPDFRGKNGIYTTGEYDPYKTFDFEYYKTDPSYFFRFALSFLDLLRNVKPTKMHRFLALLEESGKDITVITQNIDMLHEKSGSKNVLNLHGSMKSGYCLNCGKYYNLKEMENILFEKKELRCNKCGGIIKPDVVFFGEPVKYIEESVIKIRTCDLLLILGTSLSISPANILPEYARNDIYKIIINKGDVYYSGGNVIKIDEDLDKMAEFLAKEVLDENIGS